MQKTDITLLRLYNHRLLGEKFETPEEVVQHLGAVQSQDYFGGLLSIGARMNNPTEALIEDAIAQRKIVRTWPMRGTIHFVPAEDVHWFVKYLNPRISEKYKNMLKKSGVSEGVLLRSKTILESRLSGGKQMTRKEIYKALNDKGIPTKGMNGVFIISELSQQGILCSGTRYEKQQRFALLDEWVSDKTTLSWEEGLAKLTHTYFKSHGPATLKDFCGWSGLLQSEVKQGLELVGNKLVSEEIDGNTYYMLPELLLPKEIPYEANFLQPYDEYIVLNKGNSHVYDPKHANREVKSGGYLSSLIINGKVSGMWKRTIKNDKVIIQIDAFETLNDKDKSAVTTAAEKYAKYLDLKLVMSL